MRTKRLADSRSNRQPALACDCGIVFTMGRHCSRRVALCLLRCAACANCTPKKNVGSWGNEKREELTANQNHIDQQAFDCRGAGRKGSNGAGQESQMHWQVDGQLLALVVVANGMPVLGRMLLPDWLSSPVDSHLNLPDGAQVFGSSKTRRGFVLGTCAASLAAIVIGLSWTIGFAVGFTSMCGDLFSSFVKRRLGMAPSSRATFLDQIPESLFPALLCRWMFQLMWTDVALIVLSFAAINIILSKPLHGMKLRRKPY